jgi:hypothetical protein
MTWTYTPNTITHSVNTETSFQFSFVVGLSLFSLPSASIGNSSKSNKDFFSGFSPYIPDEKPNHILLSSSDIPLESDRDI